MIATPQGAQPAAAQYAFFDIHTWEKKPFPAGAARTATLAAGFLSEECTAEWGWGGMFVK